MLRGFGEGNLPQDGWPEAIREATESGTQVVVMSQCRVGQSRPGRYLGSELAEEAGAIFSGDMTGEACLVKAMWLLGQGAEGDAFRARFVEPVAGEVSPGSAGHHPQTSHGEGTH